MPIFRLLDNARIKILHITLFSVGMVTLILDLNEVGLWRRSLGGVSQAILTCRVNASAIHVFFTPFAETTASTGRTLSKLVSQTPLFVYEIFQTLFDESEHLRIVLFDVDITFFPQLVLLVKSHAYFILV